MDTFIVGSNAFFKEFEDFTPHDEDTLILVDNPPFRFNRQTRFKDNCILEWKRMSAEEFIECHKECTVGIFLGKFLVPEFAKEIGLTIQQLKELSHLINYLDPKHEYESIIFNSYIENNDFYLTEEQKLKAYKSYKENS